jgi:hypothetical protein
VNAPPRPQQSAQKSVSREQILAMIETPDSFIVWLRRFTPNAEVASIYDPVHSMLAEYVWATLEAFTMYGDSVVWGDGAIAWDDLRSGCVLSTVPKHAARGRPPTTNRRGWRARCLRWWTRLPHRADSCPILQTLAAWRDFWNCL